MSFATVFGILGRMQSAPVSLRASSRFGGVARSHARAARALARSLAARFARHRIGGLAGRLRDYHPRRQVSVTKTLVSSVGGELA